MLFEGGFVNSEITILDLAENLFIERIFCVFFTKCE